DYRVEDVVLNVSGNQSAHSLTLDVDSNIASTSLALNGGLNEQPNYRWAGQLERMLITSKQGEWRLTQPTQLGFDMASQLVSVAAHCWLQQDSSVCLE
ncbi:hypothetical protein AKJ18_31055, partial [Vibrio xuii]